MHDGIVEAQAKAETGDYGGTVREYCTVLWVETADSASIKLDEAREIPAK
jgi:hypothetical protein